MSKTAKTGSVQLGGLLSARRESLGMSRRDLVDATGLSYPYISQLETGYRMPSPAAIQALSEALNVSLDDLFAVMPVDKPRSRTSRTSSSSRSDWMTNPRYAAMAVADEPVGVAAPEALADLAGSSGPDDVVDEITGILRGLPAERRLAALAEVQSRVLETLVDEGVRRATRTGE